MYNGSTQSDTDNDTLFYTSLSQQFNLQFDNSKAEQTIVDQLYDLAMMVDVQAIEGILKELAQDRQFLPFAAALRKLTTQFQTAKSVSFSRHSY